MKIAFIGQKGIPTKIGGVERYVDEVAKRMAKHGHEVFVYVRDYYTPKNLKDYEGVKLIHLPTIRTKHLDAITHTFLATLHALFQGYDVINYQSLGPSSLSFIPKIFLRKTAIISTYHSQDYYHAKWGSIAKAYIRFSEWIALRVPDRTISIGKTIREYGIKNYGKETTYIPNGVTLFPKSDSFNDFQEWNLEKGKYILSVSRLVQHKEIHTLIEAFANLRGSNRINSDFKLVIVGGGAYTDKYVSRIKKMVQGRQDIILAGVQGGQKLAALYQNAYCFVQPSRTEGLSLALLEAMGTGLAPLVSDIPENLYVVTEYGKVFQTGDLLDLMDKLEYMINNPEKTKLIGEKACRLVKEKYDWNNIVRDIERVYLEAMEKKRGGKIPSSSDL